MDGRKRDEDEGSQGARERQGSQRVMRSHHERWSPGDACECLAVAGSAPSGFEAADADAEFCVGGGVLRGIAGDGAGGDRVDGEFDVEIVVG